MKIRRCYQLSVRSMEHVGNQFYMCVYYILNTRHVVFLNTMGLYCSTTAINPGFLCIFHLCFSVRRSLLLKGAVVILCWEF